MKKDELLAQLEEVENLADKIEELIISIKVDVDYLEADIELEEIQEALINAAFHTYHWEPDSTTDLTYEDEPEKREAFFQGVKYGYSSALFWIADFFGTEMVTFFENKIGHNFENLKKEDKND